MNQLITAVEFAAFRNISKKVDTEKVNEAILLAQQSDLVDILGDFFFDVLENKDESDYSGLMNGSSFECSGKTYRHEGIKALLADYAFARYVYMKNINDTSFGFMIKETEDGRPVDVSIIRDIARQAKIDAGVKFKWIEKYLLENASTFDRYCEGKPAGTGFLKQKFTAI